MAYKPQGNVGDHDGHHLALEDSGPGNGAGEPLSFGLVESTTDEGWSQGVPM